MRLILARMVWNFNFELKDDTFRPEEQRIWNFWSKPALNVRLSRVER
jgi:hypothetical protein